MFPHTLRQAADADNPEYTVEEWRAWQWLRIRLKEDSNDWSDRELAHLSFLRWLAVSGRLVEDGGPASAGDSVEAPNQ
jgi:hypothetical protein